MISKEDLVLWFKNLESYKRIDLMCTLLNMCLPFELRFLGTCLEELGRKDAQDLRGVEIKVNNPQEFVADVGQLQSGEPTDIKVRRKMALYLALVRACNRTCVNELFKTLDSWGDRDFSKFNDGDPMQELLLVYTMAINHPVFSFEQRMKCGEIFSKITMCKSQTGSASQTPSSQQSIVTTTSVSPLTSQQPQHQPTSITSSPPPLATQQPQQSQTTLLQPTLAIHPQPMGNPILIPQIPMTFQQIISTDGAPLLGVDNISQIQVPGMVMPNDFSMPPPQWTMRPSFNHIYPQVALEAQFPPSSTSPHLSQPSSPSNSRTGSPTRNQQSQSQPQSQTQVSQSQTQSGSHRNNQNRGGGGGQVRPSRRASSETTPPPLQNQQGAGGNISYIGNDMIVQTLKNYEELNVDGAMTQLQQLRNGYTRPTHHTIPRQTKSYLHQHHMHHQQQAAAAAAVQQQQQIVTFNPNAGTAQMAYAFGNMNLVEHQKSTGSDSGSSVGSNGDSPPDTPSFMNSTTPAANPAQMRAKQQLSLSNRLNKIQQGGSALYPTPPAQNSPQSNPATTSSNNNNNNNNNNQDFSGQVTSSNSNSSLNSSNNNNLVVTAATPTTTGPIMLQQQQQQQPYQQRPPQTTTVIPMIGPFRPANASTVPTTAAAFQMQPNGDIIFPFQPVQTVPTVFLPPPAPAPQSTGSSHSHRSSPSAQPPAPTQTPPMLLNSSVFPTSKMILSCFNCGSTTHTGRECHEASMEDVTRNATYKLDYSSNSNLHSQNTAPAIGMMTKQSVSSASLSSMGGDQQGKELLTNSASAPQFDPIPSTSPIIIDLTQDTSSSSSSSE